MRLSKNNLVAAGGLHEEKNTLYLTLVDGRVHESAGNCEPGGGDGRGFADPGAISLVWCVPPNRRARW